MTTYREAADQAFATMIGLWDGAKPFNCGGGCFWMAGNTFHAAVDYLIATGQPDKFNLVESAVDFFESRIPKTPPDKWVNDLIWLDDYGWWGIALTRAYNNRSLGYNNNIFLRLEQNAKNCWIAMEHGWVNTALSPTVPIIGGVANTTDGDLPLAGRNCVTNEVFWLLSHYLYAAFGDRYLVPNNAAFWFSEGKQQNVLFNSAGFVLERFRGVPNGVPAPEWSWLGDQGLFMYGCTRNLPTAPGIDYAQAEAVANASTHIGNINGILSEELCPSSLYYLDYAAGKGVFMRYLGYMNSDAHPAQRPTYDQFIMTNAAAVWNNRSADGTFHYWWQNQTDPSIDWGTTYGPAVVANVLHASGFAALTACLQPYTDMGGKTIPLPASVALS